MNTKNQTCINLINTNQQQTKYRTQNLTKLVTHFNENMHKQLLEQNERDNRSHHKQEKDKKENILSIISMSRPTNTINRPMTKLFLAVAIPKITYVN